MAEKKKNHKSFHFVLLINFSLCVKIDTNNPRYTLPTENKSLPV